MVFQLVKYKQRALNEQFDIIANEFVVCFSRITSNFRFLFISRKKSLKREDQNYDRQLVSGLLSLLNLRTKSK